MQPGPAKAAWTGHDPGEEMDAMDAEYDNPPVEDVFAEQSSKLGRGILDLVRAPIVRADEGIPAAALETVKAYLEGNRDSTDLVANLKNLRQSAGLRP